MLADILTKALPKHQFQELRAQLGVVLHAVSDEMMSTVDVLGPCVEADSRGASFSEFSKPTFTPKSLLEESPVISSPRDPHTIQKYMNEP